MQQNWLSRLKSKTPIVKWWCLDQNWAHLLRETMWWPWIIVQAGLAGPHKWCFAQIKMAKSWAVLMLKTKKFQPCVGVPPVSDPTSLDSTTHTSASSQTMCGVFYLPQIPLSLSTPRFYRIHSDLACPQSFPLWEIPDSSRVYWHSNLECYQWDTASPFL